MTVANDIKQPLLHIVRDEEAPVKLTHTAGDPLKKYKAREKAEKKEENPPARKGLPPQEKGYIKYGNYDCL